MSALRPHGLVWRLAALGIGLLLASDRAHSAPDSTVPILRESVRLSVDSGTRELLIHVRAPGRGHTLPVIFFSHGAYSAGDAYDEILEHWARAGYVVLAPTHRDSVTLGVRRGTVEPRYFEWRLDDFATVVARLADILARIDGLPARTDTSRIAATGHSFGGLVAQTLGGATYRDVARDATVARPVPDVRAVLIFSGAGTFAPLLERTDFAALALPTFVTVGTADLEQAPGLSGYAWRRQPFDFVRARPAFLLTLRDADHYLGGRVGRTDLARHPRGAEFVATFNLHTTRFLDGWLRGDARAREQTLRLTEGTSPRPLGEIALLERRMP